jgi:hypothetical protein
VERKAHVAGQLREQADACEAMGSPFYARLLRSSASDVEEGGPCWDILRHDVRPGRGDAVALRFLAAVHRLVLTGRAPDLARHYPSAGGIPDPRHVFGAFIEVVVGYTDELVGLTARPCQTNEVGRAAALVFAFLEVAARTERPLRLLELGASAGLNLRFDRFLYGGGGATWGDPGSPVDLRGLWLEPPPALGAHVTVMERRGCDRRPLDTSRSDDRLTLLSSVWGDQTERFARLAGALRVAEAVPATIEDAEAAVWVGGELAGAAPGVATIVFQSVVEEYLGREEREALGQTLAAAGERASEAAPLARVRLEPLSDVREHGVWLTLWPGGEERLLARAGAHGGGVKRA